MTEKYLLMENYLQVFSIYGVSSSQTRLGRYC